MIVKFHARGSGAGSGPIDYLLGKDRQREGATLDRGDPVAIMAIIDASPYAKKYTSGVLSFSEPDLDRESKDKIMSDFEKMMFPGLDADQYACLWVEHRDKDRLELNFVIPNIELHSGKRLQPWYKMRDFKRVNNWKDFTNHEYKLTDPDNPLNIRHMVTPRYLPTDKKLVVKTITDSLMRIMGNGAIANRADVVKTLTDAGFQVSRESQNSISIANPDGGKNIRLRGAIYERNFEFNAETGAAIERSATEYTEGADQRIQRVHKDLEVGIEILRAHNQRRYPRLDTGIEFAGFNHEANSAQVMAMVDPNDNHRFSDYSGRPVVSGQPDSGEPSHDRTPKPDLDKVTESNFRGEVGRTRQQAIHTISEKQKTQPAMGIKRPERSRDGEKINDGIRVTVTRICKSVSAAASTATSGIVEQLQGFAAHVRDYISRESGTQNAGAELGAAGQRLGISTEKIHNKTRKLDCDTQSKNSIKTFFKAL